ncbi:hypothetical protein [Maribacter sp. 2307ULW6-5]|uniref:hypothetical protein n=1 Tax=Maribacter sp. 2307ULW6-5 TaxID=3386275 RepID=UPI0039BD3BEA
MKIGDAPEEIDAGSLLELESTSKTLVLTRVNNAQMQALEPLPGALVYNTDRQCAFVFNGAQWNSLCQEGAGLTLEDNGDGTYSFVNANGGTSTFNGAPETETILTDNGDGTYDYTNENGVTTTITGGTALEGREGSVFFAKEDGAPTEDNANLHWDAAANALGLGTAVPNSTLHVNGSMTTNFTFMGGSDLGVNEQHHTVLINDPPSGDVNFFLPDAGGATGRIYIIKKLPGINLNINPGYYDEASQFVRVLPPRENILWLQSNGFSWEKIN